jgi:putative salt-induced outer membrane protein YdiY
MTIFSNQTMTVNFQNFRRVFCVARRLILFLICAAAGASSAEDVVLHLKSGDQISGWVVSEGTNQVVISNAWAGTLSVPLAEIAKRETMAVAKAAPPTNAPAAKPPAQLAAGSPSVAKPAAPKGKWHGQINVGLDVLFNAVQQQDYFGSAKITYEQAYESNPKKFFRNTTQLNGEYQKTDGEISANRARASNKSDFDIGKTAYGYGSGGIGFDDIQKINSQYEVGLGLGRHMLRNDQFVLDLESGFDYQAQYRTDAPTLESVYLRLAQDLTWKILKNLTLTQKLEFYPDLERINQYHGALNATLGYGFWKNLTLNLTADESYNTDVAPGVRQNVFETRLTLGATF